MECQECHERPASLHFTQVVNGHKTEVYVCEKCAYDKGYMSQEQDSLSLHNLLSGLFNFDSFQLSDSKSPSASHREPQSLKCGHCGLTYDEFKRVGKFGCANCYKTFDERLNPIFRRVHSGNTIHNGKVPKRKGGQLHVQREMDQKRSELQALIHQEEFEEAAKVRDQIRTLERQLDSEQREGDQ
ncbi:hypothetical protein N780_09360 [Pontibacillus chungwhensis BH030062]|uniref:UVR domain-containing protein n=1 Tax=Pontibacillus chungwhensis BH030062 TaxID=1385513 RepID=A0A0A2UTF6_9BACI|nr:UvrB/UvrC motif-containing protein [Pontibacillus chungwhensis]KGP89761.1 hypothetical protein N780_09360 [Pontibacillus chungwhensis BH030062]